MFRILRLLMRLPGNFKLTISSPPAPQPGPLPRSSCGSDDLFFPIVRPNLACPPSLFFSTVRPFLPCPSSLSLLSRPASSAQRLPSASIPPVFHSASSAPVFPLASIAPGSPPVLGFPLQIIMITFTKCTFAPLRIV